MYAIAIRQWITSLKSKINGDYKCISKYKVFDVIGLLKKAKKIIAGVDTKENPALTLHENMMALFTTRK